MSDPPHLAPAAPDLSYLDPHQLRIGSVGIFAGDWAWQYDTAGQAVVPVGFVGTLTDTVWNGWAVFSCTRDVAVEIVADHQRARDAERAQLIAAGVHAGKVDHHVDEALARMEFDGDEIVVDHRVAYGDPDALWRISPDADGQYNVMGGTWTWVPVAADDCRRIAGTLPAEGDRQRFVYLIHSDLRAPHDRLAIASLEQLPTGNGVAFTATLHLDGHTVGTVTNTGTGGPTTLHTPGDRELEQRLADFVAQCRWHGQPATQEQVIDALVDEHDFGLIIAAATDRGGTVARLLDRHGLTVAIHALPEVPDSYPVRDALGRQLAEEYHHAVGEQWVLWTGDAWRFLTPHTR